MSKNLFSIPVDAAEKVLSFLSDEQALIFYTMYSILNKVEDFIPKDYCFEIQCKNHRLFFKYKYIKNLTIVSEGDNKVIDLSIQEYSHLESFRTLGYISSIGGIHSLTGLKTLDLSNIFLDINFLKTLKNLKEYKGGLILCGLPPGSPLSDMSPRRRLKLRSFRGSIEKTSSGPLLLDQYFDRDELEEFVVTNSLKEELIFLYKFKKLKKLGFKKEWRSLENLRELTNIEELDLKECLSFDWTILSRMTNLKKLSIVSKEHTYTELLPEAILNGLTEFYTDGMNYFKNRLSSMTNLKTLRLDRFNFGDLKLLPTNLEHLTLYSMEGDMCYFRDIVRFPLLKILRVGFGKGFRNKFMKYIAKLSNLEELNFFPYSYLTRDSLRVLAGLTKLKRLTIARNKLRIDAESFGFLPQQGLRIISPYSGGW